MRKKILKNTFEISNVFKILSNEDRLAILAFIDDDAKDVTTIQEHFKLPQSTASNHLSLLKEEWLLESKRTGRIVKYKVSDKKVLKLMKQVKKIYL